MALCASGLPLAPRVRALGRLVAPVLAPALAARPSEAPRIPAFAAGDARLALALRADVGAVAGVAAASASRRRGLIVDEKRRRLGQCRPRAQHHATFCDTCSDRSPAEARDPELPLAAERSPTVVSAVFQPSPSVAPSALLSSLPTALPSALPPSLPTALQSALPSLLPTALSSGSCCRVASCDGGARAASPETSARNP